MNEEKEKVAYIDIDGAKLKEKLEQMPLSMRKMSAFVLGKGQNYLQHACTHNKIEQKAFETLARFIEVNANEYILVRVEEEKPQERAEAPTMAFSDENILIHLAKVEKLLMDLISATRQNTIHCENNTRELKEIKRGLKNE